MPNLLETYMQYKGGRGRPGRATANPLETMLMVQKLQSEKLRQEKLAKDIAEEDKPKRIKLHREYAPKDEYETGLIVDGFIPEDENKRLLLGDVLDKLEQDPELAKAPGFYNFVMPLGISKVTAPKLKKEPVKSELGKLVAERDALPTGSQTRKIYDEAISKKVKPNLSEIELTRLALKGDQEAKAILDEQLRRKVEIAKAQGLAAIEAKLSPIAIEKVGRSVLMGTENIDNVRNTFGLAVQEAVRAYVLKEDPDFNFLKPRVKIKAVQSTLSQQYKQRGMMGSFVKNLDKQLIRTDEIIKDVVSRVGLRAIDLPIRELNVKFKGSGHERALEAYLIEISNEIGKLSTGSAQSIRELSTDAQERWSKIHDPNLSFKELKKILDETNVMAHMRLDSTDEEIVETMSILDNIREDPGRTKVKPAKEITRTGIEQNTGRKVIQYSDGTIEYAD